MDQDRQLTLVTIVQHVIQNCLLFAVNKQGTEFLTVWSCHRLPYKKFQFHGLDYDYIMNQPPETSESANICMLIACFLFM